jgi:site-specific DNA-methyltransferase (adenine-specific)
MQYLVRLITPPNGIVLDPFCGSGTTGIACKLEGFNFVGLEREEDYAKIAQARIDNWFGASAVESVPESSPSARLEKPKEIPTQLKFNF